jgi:hypothetical protein
VVEVVEITLERMTIIITQESIHYTSKNMLTYFAVKFEFESIVAAKNAAASFASVNGYIIPTRAAAHTVTANRAHRAMFHTSVNVP